jgi:hypothetical protein
MTRRRTPNLQALLRDLRSRAYLIRIPQEADQERALVCFRSVRDAVHSVEEDEFLVTGEHLEALRSAGVPFEDITETLGDHDQEKAG